MQSSEVFLNRSANCKRRAQRTANARTHALRTPTVQTWNLFENLVSSAYNLAENVFSEKLQFATSYSNNSKQLDI